MRGVLWIAVCFLIGLTSNAIGAPYSTDAKNGDFIISLAGLFKKISDQVTSVIKSVKNLAKEVETDLKRKIDENPLLVDLKSVYNDVQKSIKDVITEIRTIDEFRKLHRDPKMILSEVEQSIENNIIDLVVNSNSTKDPELIKELLQAIFEYPEIKGEVEILIKKCLADILSHEYVEIIEELRYELKKIIGDLVKSIESYISEKIKTIEDGIEHFVVFEAEDAIGDVIKDLIDKLFDDFNERTKRKMDDLIDIKTL